MCDSATMTVIESVLTDKIGKQEMFTAHDITRACRQQVGPKQRIDHNDVKTEVHGMFVRNELNGYTRSLANLPNVSGPQPFVYHPFGADTSTYGGQAIQAIATTPNSTIVVPSSIGPATNDDGDDGVNITGDGSYKVDSRQTLCVPKRLLEAVGLKTGDEAYVSADKLAGSVVVTKATPDQSVLSPLSTYTVDKYGNVRVTQYTLMNGGVGGKLYDITGDSDKVSIRLRAN